MKVDLAVVVITRNEAARVRSCVSACLAAIQRCKRAGLIRTSEVVLVDSASTDRTIEIASELPITVIRLEDRWPLSAAAGRFIGLRNSQSELVLFVDGDYVLFEGWLPSAIQAIRGDDRVAAVCGLDMEEAAGDSLLAAFTKKQTEAEAGEPEAVPIGLYRRDAILAAGGINPFLRGGEDRDLAQRLRESGYRLRRIEDRMGVHHWSDSERLDFLTYFRSVLAWSIGDGQSVRGRLSASLTARNSMRRYANARYLANYFFGLIITAVALGNCFFVLQTAISWIVLIDVSVFAVLLAIRTSRGWSWRKLAFAFHVIPYSVIRHGGFVIGLLLGPSSPARYPTGERVRQQSLQER